VYDAVPRFAPLQRHLNAPLVKELWINEPGRVFVGRRGRSELTTTILDDTLLCTCQGVRALAASDLHPDPAGGRRLTTGRGRS